MEALLLGGWLASAAIAAALASVALTAALAWAALAAALASVTLAATMITPRTRKKTRYITRKKKAGSTTSPPEINTCGRLLQPGAETAAP
jgi:membrane protein implicated in regulation of membrane protease activity